ncbi:MAG: hypothetical protein IPL32_03720 [Chloracidobacterium sp.]|nr:hypothetical protein [Chloracidobacterium sp.]
MSDIAMISFKGQEYFDDRLFIFYLCKAEVDEKPDGDGVIWTTIYHEQAPFEHIWCVVTYKNCPGYPISHTSHFAEVDRAVEFMEMYEPETPLISLKGGSPQHLGSYQEYLSWKLMNNMSEYDFRVVVSPGGTNAKEIIGQSIDQFKGIM